MRRNWGIALLLFVVPGIVHAQTAPEDLMPAGAQIYMRWDGIEAHRKAYEKTALGKTMQGDTGKFITGAFTQLQESVGAALAVQQLLGGIAPDKLQKMQADASEAPKLLSLLAEQGFLISIELGKLEPPEGQITLVIPDVGDKSKPFFATLRLIAALASAEVKEVKVEGRVVYQHQVPEVGQMAWWQEGKHAVLVAGTQSNPAEVVIKRLANKGPGLTSNPLFKKVKEFKQFETGARAFVDVASVTKIAKSRGKEVAELIDDLGLDGLQSLTFYSGFDGPYERSLVEWDMPGPRKGALKLLSGKPFKMSDVPPLPPDVVNWSMTNFDAGVFYDVGVKAAESVVKLVAPDMLPMLKDGLKQVDDALGIDLRKDLLASLGDRFVTYNSPAEGPLSLGTVLAFKVKDEKKAKEAIDKAIRSIAKNTGAEITLKKKTYRNVELNEVHFQQQGFFFLPTYAFYKDWLVVAYYPQPVQGFILRATGELPAWKPDARLQESLDKLPKDFISISVSDPVPSMKQLLSIAPTLGGLLNSFVPDAKFDVSALPNAHEATRHLFPNVSLVTDDGKTLRMETRASLALPFDITGLDSYSLIILASFGFGFAGF